jgi:hypothetical protein
MDTVASNSPEGLEAYWGRVRANGTGEGNGKAGIVVTAHDFAGMVHRGELNPDDARETYTTHRLSAEIAAAANRKPLKPQNDQSRNTQVAKMRAGAELVASGHALAWDCIGWTKAKCEGSYGGWYAGVVAAKKTLAKKPTIARDDLRRIVEAAAQPTTKAAATLAGRLDSIAKAVEALLEADDHDAAIERVAAHYNSPVVQSLALACRKAADAAQTVEDLNKPELEF